MFELFIKRYFCLILGLKMRKIVLLMNKQITMS